LEDHVGFGPVQWQVAHLVHDQDGGSEEGLELPAEPAGGFGGSESADQVVQSGEVDRPSGLAGADGQCTRATWLRRSSSSARARRSRTLARSSPLALKAISVLDPSTAEYALL
jgi:hypothetical protein